MYYQVYTPAANNTTSYNVEQQITSNKLDELTLLVRQLAVTQMAQSPAVPPPRPYSMCYDVSHPIDTCPTSQQGYFSDYTLATACVGVGRSQQQYNPYSNTYNLGWGDHPNLEWGQNQNQSYPNNFDFQQRQNYSQNWQPFQQPNMQQQPVQQPVLAPIPSAQPAQQQNSPSLEDLVKQMATNNLQFQQRTEATFQSLQTQIGQLANAINQNQPQASTSLPSQTMPNPNTNGKNVSAITLRSGEQVVESASKEAESSKNKVAVTNEKDAANTKVAEPSIPVPFPQTLAQTKKLAKAALEKEILETFQKLQVNIPLLDAIKQIPNYAKFLKELYTNKRRLKDPALIHAHSAELLRYNRIMPSREQPPPLELKPFLDYLKEDKWLLVVLTKNLQPGQLNEQDILLKDMKYPP